MVCAAVFVSRTWFVPESVCNHSQGFYFRPDRKRSMVFRVLYQQTNKQTKAKGRTVLGEAQDPRVEASQGFYCSGFINKTNKQTNKTNKQTGLRKSSDTSQPVNLYHVSHWLTSMWSVLLSLSHARDLCLSPCAIIPRGYYFPPDTGSEV